MPAPGVALQRFQGADEAGAERVQVDVAHELPEEGVRLDHDRLVAVLEEVADPLVPAVEGEGVPGQPAAHEHREADRAAAEEEVAVVWENRPGVDGSAGGRGHLPEAGADVRAVRLVGDDSPPLDPAKDHVSVATFQSPKIFLVAKCLYAGMLFCCMDILGSISIVTSLEKHSGSLTAGVPRRRHSDQTA